MIRGMLESSEWTSANPDHINTFIQANAVENPDFEKEIKNILNNSADSNPKSVQELKPQQLDISKLSEKEIGGMLGKVGINPQDIVKAGLQGGGGGLAGLGMAGVGRLGTLASTVFPPALIAIMVVQLLPAIIKGLQRPGGFLDKRIKIDARNESFAELDRQTRQNTRIGDRQVIIQQFEGFRNFEGFASTNTSKMVRENADRVLNIGLFDRAQGVM
tara:strand:+ start:275 stop:925 length:651 start_codon:yes stop_codon:yes gene_type:complete